MKSPILLMASLLFLVCDVAVGQDAIWTSKPVRVDTAKQHFERLPSLVLGLEGAETINFPIRLEMQDSASFTADGVRYELKDLKAIAGNRLCRSEAGARWPCGVQAMVFVSNLFRGQAMVCKVQRMPERVALSGCRNTRLRIPFEIVAQGFAFPNGGDGDLDAALASARLRRAGVWKDAVCLAAAYSC